MDYIRPFEKKSIEFLFMKRLKLILILYVFAVLPLSAQEWSEPVNVANGHAPAFVIDRKTGKLHIVSITNVEGGGVLYAVLDSVGNIVTSPYMITNTLGDTGKYWFGPAIDLDQNGNPNVLFRQHPKGYGKYFYDVDYTRLINGQWSDPVRASVNQQRGYMSRLIIDYSNTVHITTGFQREDYFWGGVYYNRIFEETIVAGKNYEITTLERDEWRPDDRVSMAMSPDGNIHLVLGCPGLYGDTEGPVTYYRSEDGGETFKWIADIHSADCHDRNGAPDVFADKAGNVHFCFGTVADYAVNDKSSIRYVKYDAEGRQRINIPVTKPGDVEGWKWGISSVAASDDGQYVVIIFDKAPGKELYAVMSEDGGYTWSDKVYLDNYCGGPWNGYDGRDLPVVRAYRNHFYAVYPKYDRYGYRGVRMRSLRNVGDNAPVADAGGPYSSNEGEAIQLDASGSSDSGENSGIVLYEWDLDNDQVFEISSTSPVTTTNYADNYSGSVTLRVTDRIGQTATDQALITVENVAPSVDIGEDIICNEGDTLNFSAEITDPGTEDTFRYLWDFDDGTTAETKDISHIFGDNGTFNVSATVWDDDGGTSNAGITVTVFNVAPTADPGGPYTGSLGREIFFTGTAYDPGFNEDVQFVWDLDGDGKFDKKGETVSHIYNETGVYTLSLEVIDKDGASDTAYTTITIENESPVIDEIPEQVIYEKQTFSPLVLDDYVSDPDHNDNELSWQFHSSGGLLFTLTDRIIYAAVQDTEWNGTDTLFLKVSDPGNLQDSTFVIFRVLPVNDPPSWIVEFDTSAAEDDTLCILYTDLRKMVKDVDSDPSDFKFWAGNTTHINWDTSGTKYMKFWGDPDWWGRETFSIYVADNFNAVDSAQFKIKINPQPDPPLPFKLVSPLYISFTEPVDSLVFIWRSTTDPDSGSSVYYEWRLRKQGTSSTSPLYSKILNDTSYVFRQGSELEKGIYIWQVIARDETGDWRDSDNVGIIDVDSQNGIEDSTNTATQKFLLLQNYPNPFNSETKISYYIPDQCYLKLVIYNQLGQVVCVLAEGVHNPGLHTQIWNSKDSNGRDVPTGVYFYRLEAERKVLLRKMVYIR